jgi:hypothetical protein
MKWGRSFIHKGTSSEIISPLLQNAKLKQELVGFEFILYCKIQIERGWSDPNSQLLQNADLSEEEEEEKVAVVVAAAAAASVCAVIFGVAAGTWVSRF